MGGVPEINKVDVRGGDGRRRAEGKRNIFFVSSVRRFDSSLLVFPASM